MLEWLKRAFAVPVSHVVTPDERQRQLIDRVCREIIRREMTLPAQMLLTSSAPLHYLTGQMLRFMEPALSAVLPPDSIREVATFLEQPGAMEYLSSRLQELSEAT